MAEQQAHNIKALVINMDSAPTRLVEMQRQLDALGLEWSRLNATSPQTLQTPLNAAYWSKAPVPMTDNEKACFESHKRCWEIVAETGIPHLILEDDAVLSTTAKQRLSQWATLTDFDFIELDTNYGSKCVGAWVHDGLRALQENDLGAAGYVLWPSGAIKLLDLTQRLPGLADVFIPCCTSLRKAQADPALVVQARHHTRASLPGEPFETVSQIQTQRRRRNPKTLAGLRAELHRQFIKLRRVIRKRRPGFQRAVIEFDAINRV